MSAAKCDSEVIKVPDTMRSKIKSSFCAACLSHDRKLFPVEGLHLDQLCAEIPLSGEDRICFLCKAIVMKIHEFRYKACKAQALIENMIRWRKIDMSVNSFSDLRVSTLEHVIFCYEAGMEPTADALDRFMDTTTQTTDVEEIENTEYENPVSPEIDHTDTIDPMEATENMNNTQTRANGAYFIRLQDVKDLHNDLNIVVNDPSQPKSAQDVIENVSQKDNDEGSQNDNDEGSQNDIVERLQSYNVEELQIDNDDANDQREASDALQAEANLSIDDAEEILKNLQNCRLELQDASDELLCARCGQWSLTKLELLKHLATHDNEKKDCSQLEGLGATNKESIFRSLEASTSTKRLKQTHAKTFSCDECGLIFKKKATLVTHKNIHSGIRHECSICGTTLSRKYDLEQHILKQHNETGIRYDCDKCPRMYSSELHLLKHIERKHKAPGFVCPICGKAFKTKRYETAHIRRKHKPSSYPSSHVCQICDKTFKKRAYLLSHIKTIHNGERFYCNFPNCEKSFSRKYEFNLHSLHAHSQ